MLCWFPLYNVNQLCTYTYIPSPLSFPPTPPCPSRSSQSMELSSLGYTAGFRQLSMLHMAVYVCQCRALSSSHPLLPLLCLQVRVDILFINCCPSLIVSSGCPFQIFLKLHSDIPGSRDIAVTSPAPLDPLGFLLVLPFPFLPSFLLPFLLSFLSKLIQK